MKKDFDLKECPIDEQISVHINNLINTYGEAKVKNSIKTLFLDKKPNKKQKVG